MVEEMHQEWKKRREQIKAIENTTGYKEIVEFFSKQEASIDNQLHQMKGQDLEVATKVRFVVKSLLTFLKNITEEQPEETA